MVTFGADGYRQWTAKVIGITQALDDAAEVVPRLPA
jgi:hypothetical protein